MMYIIMYIQYPYLVGRVAIEKNIWKQRKYMYIYVNTDKYYVKALCR